MRFPAFLLIAMTAAAPLSAQLPVPSEGGRTVSLGQPAAWKGTATAGVARSDGPRLVAAAGLQRDLINPMLSLVAVHGEAYADVGDGPAGAGLRGRLLSPSGRLGAGLDYRATDGRADFLLSTFHPLRRGGVFGDGSLLRVDYVPARNSVTLAIDKPVRRNSLMGASRSAHDRVALPPGRLREPLTPLPPDVATQLARVRSAAADIRLTILPLGPLRPGSGPDVSARELQPVQRAAADAIDVYHHALDLAFSAAMEDASSATLLGREASSAARRILLERVLLPYNRLLGQVKKHDSVRGLGSDAHAAYLRWLHVHSGVPHDRHAALLRVFDGLVEIVEANRAASLAQWRDSRFVWLPLQFALRPEQHDTQAEIDALIELATGARFTEGNFVSYVVNEQFQYHLSRTIREARDYHVLWTHDFRGFDDYGYPDAVAYSHVLRSYLAAMTQAVRDYDRTGRFPTFIIVLDQWFYELNRGRLWMTLLEDPLRHSVRLPPAFVAWQDTIAAAQRNLREAVAGSALLQAQSRLYGDSWLHDLVKVHVNITNPADPTFWSTRVLRLFPLPDNMMRDHRKLVFYDLSEEDPYRGEAIFTGAGIGEHYSSLAWEERSLLVRGPAALPLKEAVRDLLLAQGITPDRLPHVLLPLPHAPDYDERVRLAMARNQQPLRALQVHNGAGFSDKDVNVAKAVLYTLMPPGSVIKIPDSLWNSDFWGSALLGCALRGVRVLVIAPSRGNAPVDKFGTLGRSRELLARLLTGRELLASRIEEVGGLLAVGLYVSELEVTDLPSKVRHVQLAFERYPWLNTLFGIQPRVFAGLAELADMMQDLSMNDGGVSGAVPGTWMDFEYDPRPKLHLKANFFASREAWMLLTREEWSDASYSYAMLRVSQVQERSAAVTSFAEIPDAIADVGGGMVRDWYDSLDEATRERVVFYTVMGSHNQNTRSMVIDAEVAFVIAHWPAIIPYIDLITLIGQTEWPETVDELNGLLPVDGRWKRRLANWVRLAM
jgi:phosphatidylserine/phosphatidylglycerophosphate/cardiolipin synthase-like enzyme